MIKAALEWLEMKINPVVTVELQKRSFLWNRGAQNYREIKPITEVHCANRTRDNEPIILGTVDALCSFLTRRHVENSPRPVRIIIDADGIEASILYKDICPVDELSDHIDMIQVPFVRNQHPSEFYSYDGFLDFLNQHTGDIQDEEDLRKALREIRAYDESKLIVKDEGISTRIEQKEAKGIQAESAEIPKTITIKLPTGTREFQVDNTFLLRVTADQGNFTFRLTHKANDGAYESFLEQATALLKERLTGDQYEILEGPKPA